MVSIRVGPRLGGSVDKNNIRKRNGERVTTNIGAQFSRKGIRGSARDDNDDKT